jgi:AraC-like DNA-binding protein
VHARPECLSDETQVAAMLGCGDQAAFTNAFQRWFSVPPVT